MNFVRSDAVEAIRKQLDHPVIDVDPVVARSPDRAARAMAGDLRSAGVVGSGDRPQRSVHRTGTE